jgi:hypothetical protein
MKTMRLFLLGLLFVISLEAHSVAQAREWNGGIGTGLFMLNVKGDVGVNTNLAGPVVFNDIDLNPDDIGDLMETAFGLGGYFSDGKWLVNYSFAYLKLEDETSKGVVSYAKFEHERTDAELLVGYPVYSTRSFILRAHGGIRYTKHETSLALTALGTNISNSFDYDWIDGIIGLSADFQLSKKWSWNNRVTAGYGGSEGTYSAQTGVTWRFHKHWSTSLLGKYTAVKFEEGNRGDANWYLYDVDEFGLGLNILFHW